MDAFLFQDFITAKGNFGGGNPQVIQSASDWIDLGNYEDLVLYTDVRVVTGGATMTFETAAVRQDSAFVTLVPSFTMGTGTRVDQVQASLAKVPPLRYLRWNILFGAVPSDVTFRVWLGAYSHV